MSDEYSDEHSGKGGSYVIGADGKRVPAAAEIPPSPPFAKGGVKQIPPSPPFAKEGEQPEKPANPPKVKGASNA